MKYMPFRHLLPALLAAAVALLAGCAAPHPDYDPEIGMIWRQERVGEITGGRYADPLNRFSIALPEPDQEMNIVTRFSGDRRLGTVAFLKREVSNIRVHVSTPRTLEEENSISSPTLLEDLAQRELVIISRNAPKARMIYDDMIEVDGRPIRFSCFYIPNLETSPPRYRGVFFFVNDGSVFTVSRELRTWKEQEIVIAAIRSELETILAGMEFPQRSRSIFDL